MKRKNASKHVLTCSECGKDFKRLNEACRYLKVFYKVHRQKVCNHLEFEEHHRHAKAVEHPWIYS
jgi:hypothetical protein